MISEKVERNELNEQINEHNYDLKFILEAHVIG